MAVKKTIELEAKVDKAQKDLEGVAKSVQRIDDNLEDVKDTTGGVAKGVKGIGNALKAAGVGLAIAAFAKLAEVFNQNQKVADAFNTVFETLSLAFNDFFKFLDANVGTVIEFFKGIFNDPIQSIKDFGSAIKQGFIDRLKQGLEALGLFGKAALKFFSGDFAGAALTAKEASKELFDIVTGEDGGYEKITQSVKGAVNSIVDYTKSTIDAAKGTVELNKQAEIAAVINQGLIEKYDRQAEQQRQLRDDETKTIEERIAANNRLGEILDEQAEKMLENVDITIKAAQAEYNKNQNQENYIALLEAQNEREAVLAQIEGFRSEQILNRISLEKEAADLKKEAHEKELEQIEATKKAEEEAAKLKRELEEQNMQTVNDALSGVASLIGENTAFGKATAIAQAVMDTYAGANKALAQGGLFGAIGAAGIIATGIANVKSIADTQIPMPPSGGISSAPQAPSFNVVGAAPENQLAQVIGAQEQKPIKAYVVGDEVTNQQALDRKIQQGASLG